MADNKDTIIKSLCDTINRQEKEITYLLRDREELKEIIEDMKEKNHA